MTKFTKGDQVYDVADERHVGTVTRTIIDVAGKRFANVRWNETGWQSFMLPAASLRRAPRDHAPSFDYATLEGKQ